MTGGSDAGASLLCRAAEEGGTQGRHTSLSRLCLERSLAAAPARQVVIPDVVPDLGTQDTQLVRLSGPLR